MNAKLRFRFILILLCVCLFVVTVPAHADFNIGPSKGQVVGVVVAIVVVGAALGIGIYFLARRPPSLTGCATSDPGGLSLRNESDQQTYTLIGDTASIKPGDRIHVSGKKKTRHESASHNFIVEKLSRDYGPCKVLPATP